MPRNYQYSLEQKARRAEQARARYLKNREEILERQRDYYTVNKTARLAYGKRYYEENKPKALAVRKAWRDKHPKRVKALVAAWSQENKLERKAIKHNYEARKRAAGGAHTVEDLNDLWDKQLGVCANPNCSTSLEISCSVDHIVPVSKGGTNNADNLQLLCRPCNSSKRDLSMEEWLARRT